MPQIREIKRRMKSINNTAKVTHAMELVAAAKMRKSQQKALLARPYTINLHQIIAELRPQTHKKIHNLLKTNNSNTSMVILLTSDRGLVGGLNLNVFRLLTSYQDQHQITRPKLVVVGKKGLSLTARTGGDVIASFGSEEIPFLDLARTITKLAIDSFLASEVASVFILYPNYESTVKQTPTIEKLLPIDLKLESATSQGVQETNSQMPDFLFEPSADQILEELLPHHILTRVYQKLLEAKASEHSATMVAMKNATDAANDLVDDLTLTYNQARQEAITKELLDIVTAQSAFN